MTIEMVPNYDKMNERLAQERARQAKLRSVTIDKPRKLATVQKNQADLTAERVTVEARIAEIESQLAASFARGKYDAGEMEAEHARLTTRLKGLDAAALRLEAERLDADRAVAVERMAELAEELKQGADVLAQRAAALRAARDALQEQTYAVAQMQRTLINLERRITSNPRNSAPVYADLAQRAGLRDVDAAIDAIVREFKLSL